MKVLTRFLLGIGGALLAIDGIIKVVSPNFTFCGMNMPCGVSLILVGLGLLGLAIQK